MTLQKKLKYLLGMICLVSLAACSSHRAIAPNADYRVDGGAIDGKGHVVMTVNSSGLYDVPISLFYRKVANRSLFNIGELSLTNGYKYEEEERSERAIFKPYAKKYGQLSDQNKAQSIHVFKLTPGLYEFYGMFIEDEYEQAEWTTVRDFSFKFSVAANSTTYIGNLELNTKVIGNNDYIVESELSRHNRLLGDSVALNELYPKIDLDEVIISSEIVKDKDVKVVRRHYGKEISLGNGRQG